MTTSQKKREELVLAQEQNILDALKECDVNKLSNILHDDLLFTIPTGQTVTKEMDLANLASGNLKITAISLDDTAISLIENNAIVSTNVTMKGTFIDTPIDGEYKYLRVWREDEGEWRVIGGSGIQLS